MTIAFHRRRVHLVNRLWRVAGALLWPLRAVAALHAYLTVEARTEQGE